MVNINMLAKFGTPIWAHYPDSQNVGNEPVTFPKERLKIESGSRSGEGCDPRQGPKHLPPEAASLFPRPLGLASVEELLCGNMGRLR